MSYERYSGGRFKEIFFFHGLRIVGSYKWNEELSEEFNKSTVTDMVFNAEIFDHIQVQCFVEETP